MPTKKIRDSERRRCIQACYNCQRRKQRCDGTHPCKTCRFRNRSHECFFSTSQSATAEEPGEPFVSESGQLRDKSLSSIGDATTTSNYMNDDHQGVFSPLDASENQHWLQAHPPLIPSTSSTLKQENDTAIIFEDYSTLSLLQDIRRCVRGSSGQCPFVDDPFQLNVVEESKNQQADWLNAKASPEKPSLEQGALLVRHFIWATSCIVDLFDESLLLQGLPEWINGIREVEATSDAIYYLVSAIGAQTSPYTEDELGRKYLNYGRYLTALHLSEMPCVTTAQCHTLIAWYLLSAGQKTSADMHIATATQVAYALGLHRIDHAMTLEPEECTTRERLWKSIRVLDGHLSLALGRPPLIQSKNHAATINGNYSACLDLCDIFDNVVSEVYAKRMVSTELVRSISEQHRRWTASFREGLVCDNISPMSHLRFNGTDWPNIGLYHIKEAFYWTINLLTLPFLLDVVSRRVHDAATRGPHRPGDSYQSPSRSLMVDTCVGSAVSTIEMLQLLERSEVLPKKMPFIANSVFIAALTLGIAFFGDLDQQFPLERHLSTAKNLLARLGSHDLIAKRETVIIGQLEDVCHAHVGKRVRKRMEMCALQVESMFGTFHRRPVTEPVQLTVNDQLFLSHQDQRNSKAQTSLASASIVSRDFSLDLSSYSEPPERHDALTWNLDLQAITPWISSQSPTTLYFNALEEL